MTTVPIIAQESAESLGGILPVWSVLPFAALLASIAILPLVAHAWWKTACGQAGISVEGPRYLAEFLEHAPTGASILAAISCGAVRMGANSYIGDGPNFMVKAIAEENGVKMPSFFGYMVWSAAILLPIFVVITLLFFL